MICGFNEAWIGPCQKTNCTEHLSLVCCVCFAPATHNCEETASFVCGSPLCDDCEHRTSPQGDNGNNFQHCKKVDQRYLPWYARDFVIKYDNCDHTAKSQDYRMIDLAKMTSMQNKEIVLPQSFCKVCEYQRAQNI